MLLNYHISRFVLGLLWACNTDTTQMQPHQISNTHRTESKTTNVVIQQHSHKPLMMDILMSETRCVHRKWNKVASDIKLVFNSSTITMMHGPINTRFTNAFVKSWHSHDVSEWYLDVTHIMLVPCIMFIIFAIYHIGMLTLIKSLC